MTTNYTRFWRPLLIVCVAALIQACGITSRYRLDLFVVAEDVQKKKVNVERTEFIAGAVLGDPYSEFKYVKGNGNVAVVTVATRWDARETEQFRLLGFDEYWRCRMFLELPRSLESGRTSLEGNSFLHLLGRYDESQEAKIFTASSGHFTLDSVNSKNVFFTINGEFVNSENRPLEFDGQFKVKRAD